MHALTGALLSPATVHSALQIDWSPDPDLIRSVHHFHSQKAESQSDTLVVGRNGYVRKLKELETPWHPEWPRLRAMAALAMQPQSSDRRLCHLPNPVQYIAYLPNYPERYTCIDTSRAYAQTCMWRCFTCGVVAQACNYMRRCFATGHLS